MKTRQFFYHCIQSQLAQLEMTEIASNVLKLPCKEPFWGSHLPCARAQSELHNNTNYVFPVVGFTGKCCYPGVRGEGLVTLIFSVLSHGGKRRPGPSLESLFLLRASQAQEGSHWEVNENKGTHAFCSDWILAFTFY